jgi:hypothetical protein
MATVTNVPQSIEQSKLAVVPFPAIQQITQLELVALLSLLGRLHPLHGEAMPTGRLREGRALSYSRIF